MILGFAGKAATGKTTAARHLESILQCDVVVLPMAKVLRDEVEDFLRRCGADDHIPLLYGSQEDKVTVFYVDEQKALAECEKWCHYLVAHSEIQDRSGVTAVTTRRILQWWGTEYRRNQDPDYWTKAWGRKVKEYDLDRSLILVDDVRFVNELDVIRAHGGLVVRVVRPGFNGANDHSSENSLDHVTDWTATVVNDGTLEAFKQKIEDLAQTLNL